MSIIDVVHSCSLSNCSLLTLCGSDSWDCLGFFFSSRRRHTRCALVIGVQTCALPIFLNELRLPAIKVIWPEFTERADKEGWPATRLLAALTEHEMAERDRRRIERHLSDARLPPGKTLDSFAFDAVPMVSRAQVTAMTSGDGWLEKGEIGRVHVVT